MLEGLQQPVNGFNCTFSSPPPHNAYAVICTPVALGKTGSERCMVDQTGRPQCTAIPGAADLTDAMFLRMASIGAKFVGDAIFGADGSVKPQDIRSAFASQGTVPQVFNLFDLNHDGIVTLSEIPGNPIAPSASTNIPAVQDVVRLMLGEMALGAGGEKFANFGVKLSDLPHRLCNNDQGDNEGSDAPKVCPIFPEPPASSATSRPE